MKKWYKQYEPRTLDEYVFQSEDNRAIFSKIVEEGDMPDLLLTGTQGSGKSTIAQVLINELNVNDCDVLVVNASKESGIDTVRTRIGEFVSALPLGKFKVVVLEEADGLTPKAQKALRNLIDSNDKHCRFIFTANYPHLIIPALKSRFTVDVHFEEFDIDEIIERVVYIIEQEGVEIEDPDVILEHIEANAPDLRKVINSIQLGSVSGVLKPVRKQQSSDLLEEWTGIWEDTPTYEKCEPLMNQVDESNYEHLFEVMYTNVTNLPEDRQHKAIVLIAKYLYQGNFVANQMINMNGCLIEIFKTE